jgi:hypothetical protein
VISMAGVLGLVNQIYENLRVWSFLLYLCQ